MQQAAQRGCGVSTLGDDIRNLMVYILLPKSCLGLGKVYLDVPEAQPMSKRAVKKLGQSSL